MATYNITKSDGTAGPAIPDAASPDTQTDLQLVGQNAVSYGLDVAQSFYFLLESFAKDTAPAVGGVTGQLWYDKGGVSTTPALNIWSGSAWKPLASIAVGASADSMARWDNTAKAWTEETQVTLTAGGVLTILDSGLTDSVAFSHDGTDFNIVGTATADINITSGITAVNLPEITLVTALAEIEGGTGTDTYTTGDILYSDSSNSLTKLGIGSNGDVLTLAAGVPSWVAGSAGVSAMNDLSDVTLTTPDTNSILYKTAGDWIDSVAANFGWNGSNLIAASVNSILAANMISRIAPGTISGVATFTNDLVMSTGDITLLDNDSIVFGTGSDVAFAFDGTDFNIAASAQDLVISGFTSSVSTDVPVKATNVSGGQVRAIGTNSSATTNAAWFSTYTLNEAQEQLRIGSQGGNNYSEVRALAQDLRLYASNTEVLDLTSTTSRVSQAGNPAMEWRAVTGNNISTTASVYDDSGTSRNVGYNETPTSVVSSARTIDVDDIGKFLSRTAGTSRTVTLDLDSDIPIGGSVLVHNGHSGGTLTILVGTITQLDWIDGSGTLPASGTRTIANNGIATLRKSTTTNWQIWGNGIS